MGKDSQLNIRCDESWKDNILRQCSEIESKAKFEVSNAAIVRSAIQIGLSVLKSYPEIIIDMEKNGSQ